MRVPVIGGQRQFDSIRPYDVLPYTLNYRLKMYMRKTFQWSSAPDLKRKLWDINSITKNKVTYFLNPNNKLHKKVGCDNSFVIRQTKRILNLLMFLICLNNKPFVSYLIVISKTSAQGSCSRYLRSGTSKPSTNENVLSYLCDKGHVVGSDILMGDKSASRNTTIGNAWWAKS